MILKIQLLRLVHNFCSHSAYKHVLLSYGEIEELKGAGENGTRWMVARWGFRRAHKQLRSGRTHWASKVGSNSKREAMLLRREIFVGLKDVHQGCVCVCAEAFIYFFRRRKRKGTGGKHGSCRLQWRRMASNGPKWTQMDVRWTLISSHGNTHHLVVSGWPPANRKAKILHNTAMSIFGWS